MNQAKIGKYIAKKRRELGLTQVQLAEKIGMSDKSVSKWERGICLPDVSIYTEICRILGITVNEFLAGEDLSDTGAIKCADETILTLSEDNKKSKKKLRQTIIGMVLLIIITITGISCYFFYDEFLSNDYVEFEDEKFTKVENIMLSSKQDFIVFFRLHYNEKKYKEPVLRKYLYKNGTFKEKSKVFCKDLRSDERKPFLSRKNNEDIVFSSDIEHNEINVFYEGMQAKDYLLEENAKKNKSVSNGRDTIKQRKTIKPGKEIPVLHLVYSYSPAFGVRNVDLFKGEKYIEFLNKVDYACFYTIQFTERKNQ